MKKTILVIIAMFGLLAFQPVFAQLGSGVATQMNDNTRSFAEPSYAETNKNALSAKLANVIKIFLGMLGVIFVVLLISAGFTWFTAGGDSAKVTQAKDRIIRATIGLFIIISAYTITFFIFKQANDLGVVGESSQSSSDPSFSQP